MVDEIRMVSTPKMDDDWYPYFRKPTTEAPKAKALDQVFIYGHSPIFVGFF